MKRKRHSFKDPFSSQVNILFQVLGPELAKTLSEKMGGEKVYFPKKRTFDSEIYRARLKAGNIGSLMVKLVSIVGVGLTHHLCKFLGGQRVRIPKYSRLIKYARNQQVVAGFNGSNFEELARKFDLTSRHVERIINSSRMGRRKLTRRRRRVRKSKEKRL